MHHPAGFILNDLLNNAERVGDHCSNIAVSVIEEQEKQAASHAYLHSLKKNDGSPSSFSRT